MELVKQKTLIIWGENDRIISNKIAVQLHCELPDAIIRQIPNCGHFPHVEKSSSVVKLIVEFVQRDQEIRSMCFTSMKVEYLFAILYHRRQFANKEGKRAGDILANQKVIELNKFWECPPSPTTFLEEDRMV